MAKVLYIQIVSQREVCVEKFILILKKYLHRVGPADTINPYKHIL